MLVNQARNTFTAKPSEYLSLLLVYAFQEAVNIHHKFPRE